VALHPSGEPGPYPAEVRHRIRRDFQSDYGDMARALNDCGVDVVSLQYLPAIWGGDGAFVLDFVRALKVPMVATIHEIEADPTPAQRHALAEMADTARKVVAMSNAAAHRLRDVYGIALDRVEIVPYGVSDLPFVAADTIKPRLGFKDRAVILSFGLLTPGKGFESVIEAMPEIVKAVPDARYIILGSTSPDAPEGEKYRVALEARVVELGLTEYVKFIDKFVGRVELGTWLEAADVVVVPTLDPDRTVSGTLAYAVGTGRATVSTPSPYAEEMLADGRGRIVPAAAPEALATEIIGLLNDPAARETMGRLAHEHGRSMVWWEVGRRYRLLFDREARTNAHEPPPAPSKIAARFV
jgi:glycosyltransferase involved in cell wall biosynthesis